MCQVPHVSSNQTGGTQSGVAQGFLSCHPSPLLLYLAVLLHLQLYGSPEGWTGGPNPKETVLLQRTTCPNLATFPSFILLLFVFLASKLKSRQTSIAGLNLQTLSHSKHI